jgi:hypothetical protein
MKDMCNMKHRVPCAVLYIPVYCTYSERYRTLWRGNADDCYGAYCETFQNLQPLCVWRCSLKDQSLMRFKHGMFSICVWRFCDLSEEWTALYMFRIILTEWPIKRRAGLLKTSNPNIQFTHNNTRQTSIPMKSNKHSRDSINEIVVC